jgi:hypothetical protein
VGVGEGVAVGDGDGAGDGVAGVVAVTLGVGGTEPGVAPRAGDALAAGVLAAGDAARGVAAVWALVVGVVDGAAGEPVAAGVA